MTQPHLQLLNLVGNPNPSQHLPRFNHYHLNDNDNNNTDDDDDNNNNNHQNSFDKEETDEEEEKMFIVYPRREHYLPPRINQVMDYEDILVDELDMRLSA